MGEVSVSFREWFIGSHRSLVDHVIMIMTIGAVGMAVYAMLFIRTPARESLVPDAGSVIRVHQVERGFIHTKYEDMVIHVRRPDGSTTSWSIERIHVRGEELRLLPGTPVRALVKPGDNNRAFQ